MDTIKFKHAEALGWYYKIFLNEDGKEVSRTPSFNKKHQYYQEMSAWEKAGYKIEPQFTEAELKAKEIKDAEDALENQKKTLLDLISNNEYHLISRRFVADKGEWEVALDKWAEQLKSEEMLEIFPKPF